MTVSTSGQGTSVKDTSGKNTPSGKKPEGLLKTIDEEDDKDDEFVI